MLSVGYPDVTLLAEKAERAPVRVFDYNSLHTSIALEENSVICLTTPVMIG